MPVSHSSFHTAGEEGRLGNSFKVGGCHGGSCSVEPWDPHTPSSQKRMPLGLPPWAWEMKEVLAPGKPDPGVSAS